MRNLVFVLATVLIIVCCKKEEKKQSGSQTSGPTTPGSTTHTYSVKYYGNGNTSGSVPVDTHTYAAGDSALVLENTGALAKSGNLFFGWNSDSLATGVELCQGTYVPITNANIKIYAKYVPFITNPASINSSFNCGGAGWISPLCSSSNSLTLESRMGATRVILNFATVPTTGVYSVSTISGPSNVSVTVNNAPDQPCIVKWYGKVGTVSVTATSNAISAEFSNVQCIQQTFNFPVVTVSGTVGCN